MGARNPVVGADQGFRAPSRDQESVRDSGHKDSASARIAAGQRPRPSFRHPQGTHTLTSPRVPAGASWQINTSRPSGALPMRLCRSCHPFSRKAILDLWR